MLDATRNFFDQVALRVVHTPGWIQNRLFERRAVIAPDIIALHECKLLYFAVPKVANSSLKEVFLQLLPSDLRKQAFSGASAFFEKESRRRLFEKQVLIWRGDLWRYRS